MFKLGEIIPSYGPQGEEYYIVVEVGHRPLLEKVEDYIIRNYCVVDYGEQYTLAGLIEREKRRMLSKGAVNVYDN